MLSFPRQLALSLLIVIVDRGKRENMRASPDVPKTNCAGKNDDGAGHAGTIPTMADRRTRHGNLREL